MRAQLRFGPARPRGADVACSGRGSGGRSTPGAAARRCPRADGGGSRPAWPSARGRQLDLCAPGLRAIGPSPAGSPCPCPPRVAAAHTGLVKSGRAPGGCAGRTEVGARPPAPGAPGEGRSRGGSPGPSRSGGGASPAAPRRGMLRPRFGDRLVARPGRALRGKGALGELGLLETAGGAVGTAASARLTGSRSRGRPGPRDPILRLLLRRSGAEPVGGPGCFVLSPAGVRAGGFCALPAASGAPGLRGAGLLPGLCGSLGSLPGF